MKKKKNYFIFQILLITILSVLTTPLFSQSLTLNSHNYFVQVSDFAPMNNQKPLNAIFIRYKTQVVDGVIRENNQIKDLNNTEFGITNPPLFYPSPFRLEDGAEFGYGHVGVADLEWRIYDMRGNEIFKMDLPHTKYFHPYVKIKFDKTLLGHNNLPAGVYFYVLIKENDLVGKGKFAVLP
ncbi:hypothetical protein DID75_04350 [Candidatus Marinamargulisbacteria bacterium SCGC AG-410-N11]|nr:hypothetical protein DID75_04350 [Candidatus Marinamargulisbacteria bacterium SCGC AG-410-N11]